MIIFDREEIKALIKLLLGVAEELDRIDSLESEDLHAAIEDLRHRLELSPDKEEEEDE